MRSLNLKSLGKLYVDRGPQQVPGTCSLKNCDCSWNGRLGTVVSRIQTANAIINSQGIQIVVEAPVYLVNNILK